MQRECVETDGRHLEAGWKPGWEVVLNSERFQIISNWFRALKSESERSWSSCDPFLISRSVGDFSWKQTCLESLNNVSEQIAICCNHHDWIIHWKLQLLETETYTARWRKANFWGGRKFHQNSLKISNCPKQTVTRLSGSRRSNKEKEAVYWCNHQILRDRSAAVQSGRRSCS